MDYRLGKILKIVAVVLAIGCIIILFLANLYDKKQNNEQTAKFEIIASKVKPYEKELRKLEDELSELKKTYTYSPDNATIMIGFLVSDTTDIEYIRNKSVSYGFSPIILIDCTNSIENITKCVTAADKEWEIMLYTPQFSSEICDTVVSVKNHLKSLNKKDTGVFFLRKDYYTQQNIDLLSQSGFIGYTIYHDSPTSGQAENGAVYFDYSYIRSSGTAITKRLSDTVNKKASTLVVFDMDSIRTNGLSDKTVCDIINYTKELTEDSSCSYATASETVTELSKINQITKELQYEYEKDTAQLQERINELKNNITNIYSKRDKN